jgi:hypothetical protein
MPFKQQVISTNETAEILESAAIFGEVLGIRYTYIYSTYLEIKNLSNPTQLIANLRTALLHKIN